MTQRPNYDAWHQEPGASSVDAEDVPASEHDLWGMGTEAPTRRGTRNERPAGRPDWVAPMLVIAAAILALALAWFVTRHARGGDDSTSAPTMPTTVATSPTSETSPPSSASSTTSHSENSSTSASSAPSSSPSSPSTTSSSSAAVADFPAGTVATCGDGQAVSADVRIAAGSGTSCAYVAAARDAVLAKVSGDTAATTFTVEPFSVALNRVVPLTCQRANHLTQCAGGSSVKMWVRDAG